MKISIIDTETTSLSPSDGHCIEVAVVNFDTEAGEFYEMFSYLVTHRDLDETKFSEEIKKTQHIHGIHESLVLKFGNPKTEAGYVIKEFCKGSKAILAHNADFDRQWEPVNNLFDDSLWVCTQNDINWPRDCPNRSLISIALAHGIGVVSAHRALDDCMTIARLLKRVKEMGVCLDSLIAAGLRPKATFKAEVSYQDREVAKKAGFNWDATSKIWFKKMAIEDTSKLSFGVVRM